MCWSGRCSSRTDFIYHYAHFDGYQTKFIGFGILSTVPFPESMWEVLHPTGITVTFLFLITAFVGEYLSDCSSECFSFLIGKQTTPW